MKRPIIFILFRLIYILTRLENWMPGIFSGSDHGDRKSGGAPAESGSFYFDPRHVYVFDGKPALCYVPGNGSDITEQLIQSLYSPVLTGWIIETGARSHFFMNCTTG